MLKMTSVNRRYFLVRQVRIVVTTKHRLLAEIQIANEQGKTVRYFEIRKPHKIIETTKEKVHMEDEVAEMRHLL